MFKFDRTTFLRACLGPALLGIALSAGCSSLTSTNATPTSQKVCETYESGVDHCGGGDFDTTTCQADLACNLGLYRSEVITMIQSCADRFKLAQEKDPNEPGACPTLAGYFCDDPQDKLRLAALTPTPATQEYAQAFVAKRAECSAVGASLDGTLYEARVLLADKVWAEARPCLSRDVPMDPSKRQLAQNACADISSCLVGARWLVAPFCP